MVRAISDSDQSVSFQDFVICVMLSISKERNKIYVCVCLERSENEKVLKMSKYHYSLVPKNDALTTIVLVRKPRIN